MSQRAIIVWAVLSYHTTLWNIKMIAYFILPDPFLFEGSNFLHEKKNIRKPGFPVLGPIYMWYVRSRSSGRAVVEDPPHQASAMGDHIQTWEDREIKTCV